MDTSKHTVTLPIEDYTYLISQKNMLLEARDFISTAMHDLYHARITSKDSMEAAIEKFNNDSATLLNNTMT